MAPSYHGLLVVDKPGGMTSRTVVDRAQHWFPRGTRLGHTGTLDPLATGVLVLCAGAATRLTEYVQDMAKVYRSLFRLGARSDSDDADGAITSRGAAAVPDRPQVEQAIGGFVGELEQVPPAYSAAHVGGRRAYDLARRGRSVALEPRRVRIYGIQILSYDYPHLEVRVHCGKGTYIRSLARDLGERLGCGGLVVSLRRERVGPFDVGAALSLNADAATAVGSLRPLAAAVAGLPRVTLDAEQAVRLRHGQRLLLPTTPEGATEVAVFDAAGDFVAVARVDWAEGVLRPVKVILRDP